MWCHEPRMFLYMHVCWSTYTCLPTECRKWVKRAELRIVCKCTTCAVCWQCRQHRHLQAPPAAAAAAAAAVAAVVPCRSELGCIANWISDVIAALINASTREPDIADHRRCFTGATLCSAAAGVLHTRRYVKTTAHTKSLAVLQGFSTIVEQQRARRHDLHDIAAARNSVIWIKTSEALEK